MQGYIKGDKEFYIYLLLCNTSCLIYTLHVLYFLLKKIFLGFICFTAYIPVIWSYAQEFTIKYQIKNKIIDLVLVMNIILLGQGNLMSPFSQLRAAWYVLLI